MRPHACSSAFLTAALLAITFSHSAQAQVVLPGHHELSRAARSAGSEGVTGIALPPIGSRWTFVHPSFDGVITGAEWGDATTLNISLGGSPVTLYVKNDANLLYLAVDDPNTVPQVMYDQVDFLFDTEGGTPPTLGDGLWTHAVCPSVEGELIFGDLRPDFAADDIYQGFIAGPGSCGYVVGGTGVYGAYSDGAGHVQFEIEISLTSSNLHALPGQTFGAWLGFYSATAGGYTGATTDPNFALDPSTFAQLTLATPPALAATNVIYGTQGNAGTQFMSINPVTGAATVIGSTGMALPGLAINRAGEIFATGTSASTLYRLDATTGQAFPVGPTGVNFMDALAFDRNGNLWGLGDSGTESLYLVNPTTGAALLIGPTGHYIGGLASDPFDGTLYGSSGAGEDAIYRLNTGTGAATLIGATGIAGSAPDICFDVNGHLFGVKGGGGSLNPSNLISINKSTGAGTLIGSTGIIGVSGLASQAFLGLAAMNTLYGTQGAAGELLYQIDAVSGNGTAIGPTGAGGMSGLAISRTGHLYSSARGFNSILYQLDADNGTAYLVGPTGTNYMSALAFDAADNLWAVADAGPVSLYRVDPFSAAVTLVGFTGEQLAGLAFNPYGGTLYASSGGAGAGAVVPDGIYTVNTSTGGISLVGTTGLGGETPDLAFDAAGVLYGVKGGPAPAILIAINKTTGAGTVIGPVGDYNISGLASVPYTTVTAAPPLALGTTSAMLQPARPNPFMNLTELRFSLSQAGPVKIEVFNLQGQRVTRLVDGSLSAGDHLIQWTGTDDAGRKVADGLYYVRMRATDGTATRAVVHIH